MWNMLLYSWLLIIVISTLWILTRYLSSLLFKKYLPMQGKSVFITGCDSGIGRQLAKHLDNLGIAVFAGCLFPEDQGATSLQEETSHNLKIIPIDVTNENSVRAAYSLIEDSLHEQDKGLWTIVNNAGILIYGEFDWMTWKQCSKQVDVNLMGTMRVTKQFIPLVKKSKGRIITVTSVNGRIAYPGTSVYSATKYALEGFCSALRLEMSKFDVKVIVVEPADFANSTSIMKDHRKNMTEMWDSMNQEQKLIYDNYFQKCNTTVLNSAGINRPPTLNILMEDFVDAITSFQPKIRYLSASFVFKILFNIVMVLPYEWIDRLVFNVFNRVFKFEGK